MSGILKNGIAESVFVAVVILSPKLAVLSSVYPAFVEFGLDDEYAICEANRERQGSEERRIRCEVQQHPG